MPDNDENDRDANRRSAAMWGAGLSMFSSVLAGFLIGWGLDRWLKTSPWMVVLGIVLGSAVGFYELVRLTSKLD
ncbi:MAG: putative F0F1-ATPase subunit Ca2+/Mg2+ transporter [Acidobacteriota bacterium]|nr:putative F0F1-ATPase subunit Ca2+/Mg2+ transporter [Acidobacteriota bacterium]